MKSKPKGGTNQKAKKSSSIASSKGEDKYGYSSRSVKLGEKGDPRLMDEREEVRTAAEKARKKSDTLDREKRLKNAKPGYLPGSIQGQHAAQKTAAEKRKKK